MAIPDYQRCMLPLLRLAADGKEHQLKDAVAALALVFKLSETELAEYLPSGQQPIFVNRVGWARTYLKKAALLESPRRGFFRITGRGLDVLGEKPADINTKFLERFPEFLAFRSRREGGAPTEAVAPADASSHSTPDEALEAAYDKLRSELASEILQILKGADSAQFENIVVALLVKMGYGGSRKDAGRAIGRSGDEGIDGIIKEDQLGLDNIYIQAKKWEATVGRPEVQKFAGALQGQRARKGILITTSDFSREAKDYVSRIDYKIVLIDGETLAGYMIDFGVGVSTVATYLVKKVDHDFFNDG